MATDPNALKRSIDNSYAVTCAPFNGWLSRHSFALAAHTVPPSFPRLAPTEKELEAHLKEWIDVIEQVRARRHMHHEDRHRCDEPHGPPRLRPWAPRPGSASRSSSWMRPAQVLARMAAMHHDLDLEDTRKSI